MPRTNHDTDFYAWANRQTALLRAGRYAAADMELIAQEIESLGKSEKRELVVRLTVLLLHLLKWRHQPAGRCSSWETGIRVQRIQTAGHLADNPSLKAKLDEAIASAYRVAVLEAAEETKLSAGAFPQACPLSFEQMTDETFWPQ